MKNWPVHQHPEIVNEGQTDNHRPPVSQPPRRVESHRPSSAETAAAEPSQKPGCDAAEDCILTRVHVMMSTYAAVEASFAYRMLAERSGYLLATLLANAARCSRWSRCRHGVRCAALEVACPVDEGHVLLGHFVVLAFEASAGCCRWCGRQGFDVGEQFWKRNSGGNNYDNYNDYNNSNNYNTVIW